MTPRPVTLRLIPAIHRATHQIGLYLERLESLGVTQAEAHVLAHLAANGDSTVGEVHRAFAHKRSTLTSILDRLEARELVTREISPTDRRSFVVRLTRTGRSRANAVHEALAELEGRALRGISKRAVEELLAVLGAIETAAGATDESR